MTSDTTQTEQTGRTTRTTASAEEVRRLLAPVRHVLWDLDGPICRLFAGHPADEVARGLVRLIDRLGLGGLLTEGERLDRDPHGVLLGVSRRRPDSGLIGELEEWLTRQELEAVPGAYPTPYADPLIRTWSALGVGFAVTTNNSPRAAAAYIDTRGLAGCFPYICGRTADLDLMKPHPHCLLQALDAMGADPARALMFGDAVTDFEAAQKARVPFLGYARNQRKADALLEAGVAPSCIVASLETVLKALRGRA
ncbi:HAD family hydrolase [Streptomyces sp. NPDC052701]|uniref:HAD family hydrolase n=1 Tax=Streptomyces sp. NPDC052701 TaxID=3155533 RepID=UPI0034408217